MNWFDILIIIVTLYCILSGYRSGFIKQLSSLVGVVVSAMLSGKIADLIFPYIKNIGQTPDYITAPMSFVVAFLIILIAFFILGRMLETIVKTLKMGILNKLCGSAFCLIKWFFLISIIINVLTTLDDENKLINKNITEESKTFIYIQKFGPKIIPYLKFDLLQKHL